MRYVPKIKINNFTRISPQDISLSSKFINFEDPGISINFMRVINAYSENFNNIYFNVHVFYSG
jgi:hypothetical protein